MTEITTSTSPLKHLTVVGTTTLPAHTAKPPGVLVQQQKDDTAPDLEIVFQRIMGQWKATVKVNEQTSFFSDRDFNKLSQLLTVKRAEIKRQAFLAYTRNQRKVL